MTGKMRLSIGPAVVALALSSCNSPPASPPQQANVTGGTQKEVAVPKGALQPINGSEALNRASNQGPSANPQQSPSDFVGGYAALLQAHDFDKAYKLLDPSMNVTSKQFEQKLAPYKTIHAAVRKIGPVEGAAGSLYDTVQLMLTGEKKDGTPYTLTGPLTLRRINNVTGSTPEQRQWRIYKMDLSSNPKTAERLIKQTQGGRS